MEGGGNNEGDWLTWWSYSVQSDDVSVSVSVHHVGVGRREEKGVCTVWMEILMQNYISICNIFSHMVCEGFQ